MLNGQCDLVIRVLIVFFHFEQNLEPPLCLLPRRVVEGYISSPNSVADDEPVILTFTKSPMW